MELANVFTLPFVPHVRDARARFIWFNGNGKDSISICNKSMGQAFYKNLTLKKYLMTINYITHLFSDEPKTMG